MLLIKTLVTSEGKLITPDSEKIREYLSRFKGKDVIIGMYDIGERRTIKQLRFFFGVVVDAIWRQKLKDLGYTREETADICKKIGLGKRFTKDLDGEMIETLRGLSDPDVDTLEMIMCIWKIENWCLTIGVEIPKLLTQEEIGLALEKEHKDDIAITRTAELGNETDYDNVHRVE
jgi:hypothetical protein